MADVLTLVFHPHLGDGSRVNLRLAQAAQGIGGVEVRDEYMLYPDRRIDVAAEQRACEDARTIVWQCPMYWYSTPALLKQWQDDVLAYGWAYGSSGTALRGKNLMLAITAGGDEPDGELRSGCGASFDELLSPLRTSARFVGMRWMEPFIISGTLNMDDARLERRAAEYARLLRGCLGRR